MIPTLEFPSRALFKALRPILEGKKSGKDIIARSLLVVPRETSVGFYATDGSTFLRTSSPAEVADFSRGVVCDPAHLYAVAKSSGDTTKLFLREGQLHGEFFGGEIHIPTTVFPEKLFKLPSLGRPHASVALNRKDFLLVLETLSPVLGSSDSPDLCFLFMTPHGAYASNGFLVAKHPGAFPEGAIRRRDAALLHTLLGSEEDETFKMDFHTGQVLLESSSCTAVLPLLNRLLPETYRGRTGAVEDHFTLDIERAKKILSTVAHASGQAGSLSLSMGTSLLGETRTHRGKSARFVLSDVLTGQVPNLKVQTLLSRFRVALRVFSDDSPVQVGAREDGTILMWSEGRSLALLPRVGG